MVPQSYILNLLNSDWAKSIPLMEEFSHSSCYQDMTTAMEQLDYSVLYKSRLHGPEHIERVLLLGGLIAWKEQLAPRDTRLLLTACSYHDIGRINDARDDEHGRRAARMLAAEKMYLHDQRIPEADRAMLFAMVTTHSLPSKKMEDIAVEYGLSERETQRFLKLASCLKDADNLDRVRLGDLDPSRLRHRSSRKLVLFADALYREYN